MKRKIAVLFLSGILSASFISGCGGTANNTPPAATEEAVPEAAASEAAPAAASTEAEVEPSASEEEIPDVEPAPSETYTSPDGWSVEYDTEMIAENEGEDEVSFVYQGESAGSCLLTIKTEREKKTADLVEEIKKNNPDADNIDVSDGDLAGSGLKATWVNPQYKEGNGLSEDYIVLDLNDDITLVFDFLSHKSGDDEIDIPVSDAFAMIVDSFQYEAADGETAETHGAGDAWKDITEEDAKEKISDLFVIPSDAKNVSWTMLEDATEANGKDTAIVDAQYELDGTFFDARAQITGDDYLNISGMDYEWTVEEDVTLENWADGNMKGKTYRYIGDGNMVDVITWYDVEKGISYSLSVGAEDLDGFDIQACAEQIAPK